MAREESYEQFVEKFKPKRTTDDCYTPPAVYEAVRDWAIREYHLEGRELVRPFYPGGDYEHFEYPPGCVVLDNPPFSCITKIVRFYMAREIDYFLFAPTLTLFDIAAGQSHYIVTDAQIVYENGAKVNTSFVSSLEQARIYCTGELNGVIEAAQVRDTAKVTKYRTPDNVVTAAILQKLPKAGRSLRVMPEECRFVRRLDGDRQGLYGAGFLLSTAAAERAAAERAAAERAAAERAAAERAKIPRQLSERERGIIADMDAAAEAEGSIQE